MGMTGSLFMMMFMRMYMPAVHTASLTVVFINSVTHSTASLMEK
jgi:hypothetical protein